LTDEIAAQLSRIGPPIAATRIGNRVVLARAMALGLGVVETANTTPAAAEITALAEEVRLISSAGRLRSGPMESAASPFS
jgi:chromosome partitioning protein